MLLVCIANFLVNNLSNMLLLFNIHSICFLWILCSNLGCQIKDPCYKQISISINVHVCIQTESVVKAEV